jgi:hypothetical protein
MYRERSIHISPGDLELRKQAIRAMAAVAQESLEYVRTTKTELIARLEANQDGLVEMRFTEKPISAEVFTRKQTKLDAEIAAAKKSLAETEGRLQLEQADLIMALELADDVQRSTPTPTSKPNAATTKPSSHASKIRARWDDEQHQTVVEVAGVELTNPYAALLAENTTDEALAWVKAVMTTKALENGKKNPPGDQRGHPGGFPDTDISIYVKLAERAGFEPAMEFDPHTRLAGECLQPLGHLSRGDAQVSVEPARCGSRQLDGRSAACGRGMIGHGWPTAPTAGGRRVHL